VNGAEGNSAGRDPEAGPVPLWQWATSDVLGVVIDVEMARQVGRPVDKAQLLGALAARQELVERMIRPRWLAMEAARGAGASPAEVDAALGGPPGAARREYERVLARQKSFGLVDAERVDPGLPDL